MRYLSEDGKVFNTIEECKEHETKQNKQEKERRWKEVEKARKNYVVLFNKYCEDFNHTKNAGDMLEVLLKMV